MIDRDIAFIGALLPEPKLENPFPALKVPPFIDVQRGDWHLTRDHRFGNVRGYFTPGYQKLTENWVLYHVRDDQAVTWMSITPMELESQSHHALAAHGDVLVGGLGMGVLAYNVAQKANVRTVTVIERDPDIVEIMQIALDWPHWSKVRVVQGDAFATTEAALGQYDVALFDIWPMVGDSNLRQDLQRLAQRYNATEFAAWGLEMDFVSWLSEQRIQMNRLRSLHWDMYSRSIGVPLIMRSEPRMASLAMQAVIMGVKHETDKAMRREPR
jgi:hypothetical protein